MLKDEQVRELLQKHNKVLQGKLSIIKGNLRKAATRAPQVWELVVLDAAARLGQIEYEPQTGGSPDIKLKLAHDRPLWIEVAYLNPRHVPENNQRKIDTITHWIFEEAKRRSIPSYKILPCFDPKEEDDLGPVFDLPELHEKPKFLQNPAIERFFKKIKNNPNEKLKLTITPYSIALENRPHAIGPYVSWSQPILETPQTEYQHAVFRVLKKKAKQHDIDEPRIVCIGSDVAKVLTNMQALNGAIQAAFKQYSSISAAIIVRIDTVPGRFIGCETIAKPSLYTNPEAKNPMKQQELSLVRKIRFDHWKYSWPLPKTEMPEVERDYRMSGNLKAREGKFGPILEVPANLVIGALAGRTSLIEEYRLTDKDNPLNILNGPWEVKTCSFKPADYEAGDAPKIIFEFTLSDSPFCPSRGK